ncbi:DUF998 domain-containing protein [Luteimonas cellulosilyticus]|nr:DUF998 domain-containing protein [Luteimonas cellulosilyticus]
MAFWSAVLSYALLLLVVVWGGSSVAGYSHVSQYMSELGAAGAPDSHTLNWLGFVPAGILLMVFAFTAPLALPRAPWTWLGFTAIAYCAFGLTVAGFFPCDTGCRPRDPTPSQVIHDVMAITGYLAGITGLLILGIQARRWPGGTHLFPLGILCWVVAIAALPAMDPDSGFPGLAQRVIEVSLCVWILTCVVHVRRSARLQREAVRLADAE